MPHMSNFTYYFIILETIHFKNMKLSTGNDKVINFEGRPKGQKIFLLYIVFEIINLKIDIMIY